MLAKNICEHGQLARVCQTCELQLTVGELHDLIRAERYFKYVTIAAAATFCFVVGMLIGRYWP